MKFMTIANSRININNVDAFSWTDSLTAENKINIQVIMSSGATFKIVVDDNFGSRGEIDEVERALDQR